MPFTDDWQQCLVLNHSDSASKETNKAHLKLHGLVEGLSAFEAISISISVVIYLVVIIHLLVRKRRGLGNIPALIQFNLCLNLALNHVALGLGFLVSPCRLLSIQNKPTFVTTCLALSTIQMGSYVALFTWILVQHIYLQVCAANVR